jgi:lysophospholipase L1-like esterase
VEASHPATGPPRGDDDPALMPRRLRYVALGDSYTIGTALTNVADRWPDRLVAALAMGPGGEGSMPGRSPGLELVANLAVNGLTSRDVIDIELPRVAELRPGFASLLVGVNDVVQGVPPDTFRANAARILDDLLELLPRNCLVTIATPDYTVTPQGASYGDPAVQATGIRAVNAILRELATQREIAFVDIHDLSLRAADDRSLVAVDGLHPSGAQYALWVERIRPVVAALLADPPSGAVLES